MVYAGAITAGKRSSIISGHPRCGAFVGGSRNLALGSIGNRALALEKKPLSRDSVSRTVSFAMFLLVPGDSV